MMFKFCILVSGGYGTCHCFLQNCAAATWYLAAYIQGYISPTVEIHGHRDVACTESPGNNLYAEIRRWKNYKGGRLPLYYCKPLGPPVVNKDIVND